MTISGGADLGCYRYGRRSWQGAVVASSQQWRGHGGGGSVFARQQAIAHPDKPAIIMASSGETVTFGEYEARSNRVAHLLRDAGLGRGDHIAVFIENCPQLLEIEGGAERVGLYYSLINTYLGAAEVAYVVADSQAKVLFSSAAKREVAEAAAAKCPGLGRMLMTGPGPLPAGWESYDAAVARYPGTPVPGESLGAAMLYSSGTTGHPKGIVRDLPMTGPDEPLPVMELVRAMFGFREGMTYLNPAPLYHSAPHASVSAALRMGCTAIVMERFDPEQWLALVERYRVTHCQMVPVMFNRLLRLPGDVRARYDTSSLECIVHAAAPCPVHVKQAMIDWLGPIITEYYGATEANGFTFHPRRAAHLGRRGQGVPGRGGRDYLVPRRDRVRVLPGSGENG
jgi:long-chain acyl-CoA synthetase